MMRMSDAMRLGAMLAGPVHGPVFSHDGGPCRACAIGAVLLAVLGEKEARKQVNDESCGYRVAVRKLWPWINSTTFQHPITSCNTASPIISTIVFLFEVEGWSREQIADWLETVEPVEDTLALGFDLPPAAYAPVLET